MGARVSHSLAGSSSMPSSATTLVSERGDVKSDSYRYLRTTFDRRNNSNNNSNSKNKEKIYETGVAVLNHCFDDIEKFCARLQQMVSAHNEYEMRRRSAAHASSSSSSGGGGSSSRRMMMMMGRSSSGSRSSSSHASNADYDSLLRLRATPPPEVDFIDVLQKFKLALNLIAKLSFRLREPNAAQLVHFLLAPLHLLLAVSRDCRHYSSTMASRAVAPLLTREALNLVLKCLTPEQTDTWCSLGAAWTKTRDEWKGYVAPFYPIFYDGWAPDFSNIVTSTPVSPIKRQKEITDSL